MIIDTPIEAVQCRSLFRSSALSEVSAAGEARISEFIGRWWVLHTKPRNEKALALDLSRRGIAHYLPLVRLKRKHGRRVVRIELPLFPGYLFLCGNIDDRYDALTTHRIANVLEVPDQDGLQWSLSQVDRMLSSEQQVDVYPAIRCGRRCRIKGGSLAGLEGVVLRRRNVWRVCVVIDVLGQSAEVEIDASLVEVID